MSCLSIAARSESTKPLREIFMSSWIESHSRIRQHFFQPGLLIPMLRLPYFSISRSKYGIPRTDRMSPQFICESARRYCSASQVMNPLKVARTLLFVPGLAMESVFSIGIVPSGGFKGSTAESSSNPKGRTFVWPKTESVIFGELSRLPVKPTNVRCRRKVSTCSKL